MSTDNTKKSFFEQQNIKFTWQRIGIDALGGMAHGLFCSLLIGTIIQMLANIPALAWLKEYGSYAMAVSGAAMGASIAYSMQAPPFVLYSMIAVGGAANTLGGAGGPLAVYFIALIATFAGKLVSKRTPVDIIVTPFFTILVGVTAAKILAPPIGAAASAIGYLINYFTTLQPFLMGIAVSAVMGVVLTLPISSAAICAALGLVGLAGGAGVAGCCAHMVGFAVVSFKENGWGGLFSQGLGTSMLQVPNLMSKPVLWVPPVIASIVNGPIATCVFKLQMNGAPINSGMGTSGLCGPLGVLTGWFTPSVQGVAFAVKSNAEAILAKIPNASADVQSVISQLASGGVASEIQEAMPEAFATVQSAVSYAPSAFDWLGILIICFIIPAVVSILVGNMMRKSGIIKDGDYKINC